MIKTQSVTSMFLDTIFGRAPFLNDFIKNVKYNGAKERIKPTSGLHEKPCTIWAHGLHAHIIDLMRATDAIHTVKPAVSVDFSLCCFISK